MTIEVIDNQTKRIRPQGEEAQNIAIYGNNFINHSRIQIVNSFNVGDYIMGYNNAIDCLTSLAYLEFYRMSASHVRNTPQGGNAKYVKLLDMVPNAA